MAAKIKTSVPLKMDPPSDPLPSDDGNLGEVSTLVLSDPDEDPWAALWGDAKEREDANVQLVRLSPENMIDPGTGQTIPLRGYVCELPPGLDSYEAFIESHFGGGKYQAVKRVKGRFVKRLTVDVAGVPKTPTSIQRGGAPAAPVLPEAAVPDTETHEGISIGGSDAQFEKRLERLAVIARIFPQPPPDLTSVLLQHVLSQPPSGGISGLKDTVEAISLLKEVVGGEGGGSEGGNDLLSLIKEGLKAFGEFAKASRPAGRPVAVGQAAPRLIPERSQAAGQAAQPETEEGAPVPELNVQQMIAMAIGLISRAFLLEPRMSPEDTCQVLADSLPLSTAIRVGMKPYKQRILNQARIHLADEFMEVPEIDTEFTTFFDAVFDHFTDPEWQPETLG
jgi:hypothetical protein